MCVYVRVCAGDCQGQERVPECQIPNMGARNPAVLTAELPLQPHCDTSLHRKKAIIVRWG